MTNQKILFRRRLYFFVLLENCNCSYRSGPRPPRFGGSYERVSNNSPWHRVYAAP